ncbi:MAG: InlB B-repeat-containing protein [Bacillota bacterium]
MKKMKTMRTIILLACGLLALLLLPAAAGADGTYNGLSVAGGVENTDYAYNSGAGTLTVLTGTQITLSGTGGVRVVVQAGVTANLTLNDLHIDASSGGCAFDMSGAAVNLTLVGNSTLKSAGENAGLRCPAGAALTINGGGSLTATGGGYSAGIGGNSDGLGAGFHEDGGAVSINSGAVTANGGYAGAGIGGGSYGGGGTVIIGNGTVTANGGDYGAGIGGGFAGGGGSTTINSGTVTANGGTSAAGIGGGFGGGGGGNGGSTTINGGSVHATGGSDVGTTGGGAGIGGGSFGGGGSITINGGRVYAAGGTSSANDIGYGESGSGGSLSLSGTAAVFLLRDACITPTTTTHAHQSITGHLAGADVYGVPVPWAGSFGAYLRLFTLSYNLNNGGGTLPDSATQQIGTIKAVAAAGDLQRTNYSFNGWATQPSGGTAYAPGANFGFPDDTILYAQWLETYSISYTLDGGTVASANPASYTAGDGAITLHNPTKPGYRFTGWSGTGIMGLSTAVTIPSGSTGARSYTAHWEAIESYTLILDSQGGAVNQASRSVAYGGFYGPLPTPVKAGSIFGGWYTGKNGQGTKIESNTLFTLRNNQTLYAKWTSATSAGQYAIAAKPNGKRYGSITGAGSYGAGAECTLIAVPASGYRFVNWTERGKKVPGAESAYTFTVAKPRSLQAVFAKIGTPVLRSAKSAADQGIKLTWGSVPGAKGYVVYRAAAKNGPYTKIATLEGALGYTDRDCVPGQTYYYRIRAYCVAGEVTTYGLSYSGIRSAKPASA